MSVAEIEKAALTWATTKNIPLRKKAAYSERAKSRFTSNAIRWLKMINRLDDVEIKSLSFSIKLNSYVDYMRHEQGLSEKTISSRAFLLRNFLTLVGEKIKTLRNLNNLIIDGIIAYKQNTDNYSRRSIQHYTVIIRSFLRYAEQKNWCRRGLTNSIKMARSYGYESLPYSPLWDDVKKLLVKTEGNHPTNIRDRAIIMLLTVYGLRSSEAVNLKLDDINWKDELLNINRAKNGKPQKFPLSKTVGESILRYIREVRPNNCHHRNIFICKGAPYRPLTTEAVYHVVKNRWESLGVKIKHYGPHSLRHACATHLINEGASLKEISDHLGHKNIETTRIYAKVNLVELRKVADLDIGDLL